MAMIGQALGRDSGNVGFRFLGQFCVRNHDGIQVHGPQRVFDAPVRRSLIFHVGPLDWATPIIPPRLR